MNSLDHLHDFPAALRKRQSAMLATLERFVRCESPTASKAAVDRFGRMVAAEWRKRGLRVELLAQRHSGNHLRVIWPARTGRERPLLVLGHLDTVYPLGSLARMPFRVHRGRAFGPGAFDMKGGLVLALFAVELLRRTARLAPRRPIHFLWTSDEETGSASSRALIERHARASAAVLVLEPASGLDGRLKTRRKAVGTTEFTFTGRAAHAGLNPEDGVNALHEMALQIPRIAAISQPRRGVTVSPTVASAGSGSNVIPDCARLSVDLRAPTLAAMRAVERRLRRLRPILPGAELELRGGFSRPPMERRTSAALFAHAQRVAAAMGLPLEETSAGGGSDGNFTAALGIPTLDGLGAVGEGPHSLGENVLIRALPERAALLAGLLASL